MKVQIIIDVQELKELALHSFQKVNPNITLEDIKEHTEGEYEEVTFLGFKVESERAN